MVLSGQRAGVVALSLHRDLSGASIGVGDITDRIVRTGNERSDAVLHNNIRHLFGAVINVFTLAERQGHVRNRFFHDLKRAAQRTGIVALADHRHLCGADIGIGNVLDGIIRFGHKDFLPVLHDDCRLLRSSVIDFRSRLDRQAHVGDGLLTDIKFPRQNAGIVAGTADNHLSSTGIGCLVISHRIIRFLIQKIVSVHDGDSRFLSVPVIHEKRRGNGQLQIGNRLPADLKRTVQRTGVVTCTNYRDLCGTGMNVLRILHRIIHTLYQCLRTVQHRNGRLLFTAVVGDV